MTTPPERPREHWASRAGFLLAAIGSAVGLGNLWGFPYKASANGGAAFVLVYLLVIALVCLPLLVAELMIGRRTGKSPVLALAQVGGPHWRWLGYGMTLNACVILAFYSVVTGWTLLSTFHTLLFGLPADPEAFFGQISQGGWAIAGHLLAMLLTAGVIALGVRGGIERLSLWFMPLLFVLLIGMALWATTLSGAGEGYRFYLQPDLKELLRWPTLTSATGHAFFSLSLGLGAIITYASYGQGTSRLRHEAGTIAVADTSVALVGGLITFPLVAHFNLLGNLSDSTIGTLFVAIPKGMAGLGGLGRLVALVFFMVLVIAALTSAVSLLEVGTAALIDRRGWPRRKATAWAVAAITVIGLLPASDSRWIDVLYTVFGETALIFGGLLLAVLMGWGQPSIDGGVPVLLRRLLRWLATPLLLVLLVQSMLHLPQVFAPFLQS
ncbi:MAG: sodium-dependent transporter [Cyanobacteria bacterium K_Offshore_0m_m2_072]|nr:sodium-dependent transporter [Cyanobacteria bacterium K_Offshore_0m_m2_072]MBM5800834.1 sodium-dependent transporter [Cyanobacteria bacterium K_DeepCast_35m_m2_023]